MQNVVLNLIIDILMAGLMLATMVYCRKLSARIKVLQDSKSELGHIIREFDESTRRATDSIAEIHLATNRLSENIQHKIDKANFLADDLQYMIEKGQKLSGKVDPTPVRPARSEAAPAAVAAPRNAPAAGAAFMLPDVPAPRGTSEMAGSVSKGPAGNRMRSRAEQEIMNALGGTKPTGE